MKVSMSAGGTAKWFAVTVASSEGETTHTPDSKFNQLIEHPDWDSDNIELKISLNGVEFDNLDDIFERLDKHIEKEAKQMSEDNTLILAKLHAIQNIINTQYIEELENNHDTQ